MEYYREDSSAFAADLASSSSIAWTTQQRTVELLEDTTYPAWTPPSITQTPVYNNPSMFSSSPISTSSFHEPHPTCDFYGETSLPIRSTLTPLALPTIQASNYASMLATLQASSARLRAHLQQHSCTPAPSAPLPSVLLLVPPMSSTSASSILPALHAPSARLLALMPHESAHPLSAQVPVKHAAPLSNEDSVRDHFLPTVSPITASIELPLTEEEEESIMVTFHAAHNPIDANPDPKLQDLPLTPITERVSNEDSTSDLSDSDLLSLDHVEEPMNLSPAAILPIPVIPNPVVTYSSFISTSIKIASLPLQVGQDLVFTELPNDAII